MKRPTKFRIGHQTWTIRWIEEKDWTWYGMCGVTIHSTSEVLIRLGHDGFRIDEQHLRETLFHEMSHVAWRYAGLSDHVIALSEIDADEYVAASLTPSLLSILSVNVALGRYLLGLTDG